jgi:oxygen-independent coproporphyrinogen-3 oxidase
MEANPGTLDFDKLTMYKEAGINRLSIGVQSLNDNHLKILNRIHSRDKALETISNVNKIFTNFNIDLMHSLPNQSCDEAILDLKDVLSITPPHLSWYQLTIEDGTPFEKNTPLLPDDDIVENIYLEGYELLKRNGYNHYEVSAFARNSFKCIHNSNYWRFGDYISFGAGAHSKLTIINNLNEDNDKVIVRTHNEDTPKRFIELVNNNQAYYDVQTVNKNELPFEYFLNRLRLFEDFDLNEFTKYTSLDKQIALKKLENAINNDLITISSNNIVSITNKGHLFVNNILEDFL